MNSQELSSGHPRGLFPVDELLAVPNLRRLVPVVILIKSINFFYGRLFEIPPVGSRQRPNSRKLREGEGIITPSTGKQPGVADVKQAVATTYNLHDNWADTSCLLQ